MNALSPLGWGDPDSATWRYHKLCAKKWADLFTTLPVAERGPRGPSLLYGIVSGGEYAYSKTSAERSAPGL